MPFLCAFERTWLCAITIVWSGSRLLALYQMNLSLPLLSWIIYGLALLCKSKVPLLTLLHFSWCLQSERKERWWENTCLLTAISLCQMKIYLSLALGILLQKKLLSNMVSSLCLHSHHYFIPLEDFFWNDFISSSSISPIRAYSLAIPISAVL